MWHVMMKMTDLDNNHRSPNYCQAKVGNENTEMDINLDWQSKTKSGVVERKNWLDL